LRIKLLACLSFLGLLAACTEKLDETLISNSPASESDMALARKAASICEAQLPTYSFVVGALAANGFYETQNSINSDSGPDYRSREFTSALSGILVKISERDESNAVREAKSLSCLVAVPRMTPEQSFELAQVWVDAFDGVTNEEAGQGLSNLAVQAWRSRNEDRQVYFSAMKTWPPLARPGAAIWLFYYPR